MEDYQFAFKHNFYKKYNIQKYKVRKKNEFYESFYEIYDFE